jgi:1-deoxyxylulose-5-phosphate synthase
VELGLAYGIDAGKPSEQDAARLLHQALDLGVNLIDTARAYGDAEAIIGRHLAGRREEYILLSKVQSGPAAGEAVERSLRELRTDRIDIMLIHCGADALPDPDTAAALLECRAAGRVRFAGASVYGEAAALAAIESDWCDCVEIAYNVLDRRPERRTLARAAERGTGVVVRSVLLKGALTPRILTLPETFEPLRNAAGQASRPVPDRPGDLSCLPELAYRFVLGHPAVHSALVGTAQIAELEAALRYAAGGPLQSEIAEHIRGLPILGEEWLNPGKWPPLP